MARHSPMTLAVHIDEWMTVLVVGIVHQCRGLGSMRRPAAVRAASKRERCISMAVGAQTLGPLLSRIVECELLWALRSDDAIAFGKLPVAYLGEYIGPILSAVLQPRLSLGLSHVP